MEGGSLRDRIRDGSLYEGAEQEVQERILRIAIQTARGLQYSHEQGLVHQDVKPGNVLLSKEWDAKVADFGLAKAQSRLRDGDRPLSFGDNASDGRRFGESCSSRSCRVRSDSCRNGRRKDPHFYRASLRSDWQRRRISDSGS